MTPLAIDILQKDYRNGTRAIERLAFRANPGEFVAIVGPSGAGKTTLLNLVAGLDSELDGTIRFGTADDAMHAPKTGFMFQEPRLMPWLTVRQNLELVLRPYAVRGTPPLDDERLGQLLNSVGLDGCASMFPDQLSGGMKRRVALLRAFIIEPGLLLMDEPFESLDRPTADHLRALLQDLWLRTRPTVLFVTHNLNEALALADRILFLSSRPSRVILDFHVKAARPREVGSASVQAMHDELMMLHPRLLEGIVAKA